MRMDHALAMARRLMADHELHGWTVVADRAKTRAGVCRFGKRQIGLSRPLTELHSEEEVRDTILHEIAHALVGPEHGHDRVWRAKARAIGSSGERCVSQEVRDTILHEIAHALVGPEHGHDRVWRAKARAIGSSGERCVSLDAPRLVGDWVGTCPAGHTSTRHRAPQRVATCSRCSRRFDLRNLIRWRYQGASVPMPERYAAELRRLLGPSGDTVVAGAPERTFAVGDIVEVVAPSSTWHGAVGEIEFVGAAKCQVRFEGGDLLAVPVPVLRLADSLASEGVSA